METVKPQDSEYVAAVTARLAFDPGAVERWLTVECPECNGDARLGFWRDDPDDDDGHVTVNGWVIVGCQGYHVIDPGAAGIIDQGWTDWTEPRDSDTGDEEDDEQDEEGEIA